MYCLYNQSNQTITDTPAVTALFGDDASKVTNVTWDNLVAVISTGTYQSVGQLHNKTVRVLLNNGTVLQTKQPRLDDIYRVIQNCSECSGKPFATE